MRIFDVVGMCLRNLYKRKLRTFLTLLGVMIGTGSIILMISLGLATNAQFDQMMENMNIDMTVIRVWPQWGGMMWSPDGGMQELHQRDITDESVTAIQRIPGVRVATPMMQEQMLFRSGIYTMPMTVIGIRPDALAAMGYNMHSGRMLMDGEEFTAVFSLNTERGFFDADADRRTTQSDRIWASADEYVPTLVDVYNDPIRIYYDMSSFWNTRDWGWGTPDDFYGIDIEEYFNPPRSFPITVVGVIQPPEVELQWGGGRNIYMDIETMQHIAQLRDEESRRAAEEDEHNPRISAILTGPRMTYGELFVRASSIDYTSDIANAIREMGYQASYDGGWIEEMRDMQRGTETLLAAIAFISLLIAAINIANTMITSVTERTREIGVMKVIGASISDIRRLFLLEAVVIGLMGGILGVGLALGGSYAMNNFDIEFLANLNMGAPDWAMVGEQADISIITPWLCGLALAIASGVGLASGYYPAWRATRLSALAAIRGD